MKKLYEKGFTAVALLLIVLVMGVVGGVGYYVMKSHDKKSLTTNQASQTQQASNTSDNQADYLVVKEWSVRMKKDSSLPNLSYSLKDNQISFATSLDLKGSCMRPSLWGITRYSPDDMSFEPGDTDVKIKDSSLIKESVSNGAVKHIGGYYFYRTYPQMGCDEQANTLEIGKKIDQATSKMFDSLETAQ